MVGIAWVVWFFSYMYRRSEQTLKKALALGDEPVAEAVARGLRYFLIYLSISGLTLPHFVSFGNIPAIVLTLAIMAVTRESLRLRTAAQPIA
jgi:ribose/xylose/arabinose/galactoside ABC-type transport system permease subunit